MGGERNEPQVNEATQLAAERAYQDGFIAERLPLWMKSATPQQRARFADAMDESVVLRSHLKHVLGRIEALDGFIKSSCRLHCERAIRLSSIFISGALSAGTRSL